MAIRRHVFGLFGVSEDQFRNVVKQAFKKECSAKTTHPKAKPAKDFVIDSCNGWHWIAASVWGVSGTKIDQALEESSAPGIRVTSSDGCMWLLTITNKAKESFHGIHHFTELEDDEWEGDEDEGDAEDSYEPDNVAGIDKNAPKLKFLWDEVEEARIAAEEAKVRDAYVPGLEDYTDFGITLPAEVIQKMKTQAESAASRTALEAHGLQIVNALQEFGLDFDRDQVLKLITKGPLTEDEEDSDLGNMPRFLNLLGIDVFQVREGESSQAEVECEAEEDDDSDQDSNDFTPDLDEEESEPDDSGTQKLLDAMEQYETSIQVPHHNVVVHSGKTGKFFQAKATDLKHVTEKIANAENERMSAFGFSFVGDIVGEINLQELTRCYSGRADATALRGLRNANNNFGMTPDGTIIDFADGTFEFHTHFSDGTALVTTNTHSLPSQPKHGIFIRTYDEHTLEQVWEKHLDGIRRFKEHKQADPVDHKTFMKPASFCKVEDRLLKRFLASQGM